MKKFELFAFYSSIEHLSNLNTTELSGYIVDLEKKGKELRQRLYDTQITKHSLQDLATARKSTDKWIICRINNHTKLDIREIEKVIDEGADEVLIPMIREVREIEEAMAIVNDRVKMSIMIETSEVLDLLNDIKELTLERCYVGLNDLAIQTGSSNIFTPLIDGTMERISSLIDKKIGVAGLTHPMLGNPIPCQWLISLMKKYQCDFGILRRTFYRD